MFESWLRRLSEDFMPLVLLGAGAIYWSFWLYRNDIIFETKGVSSHLHAIYTTEAGFLEFDCGGLSTISGCCQVILFLGT